MKFILKRRKHRKGIRPKRKGTLKVNMQELPTAIQLLMKCTAFSRYRDKKAPLFDVLKHIDAGNMVEANRIMVASKRLGHLMNLMLNGHDHLKEFKQINPMELAINVINYVDPVYHEPETNAEKCSRCPLNAECSFKKCYPAPEHRFRWCPVGTGALILAPVIRELTVAEMAELALTHLS